MMYRDVVLKKFEDMRKEWKCEDNNSYLIIKLLMKRDF
jgi:hypothetical protein